jgi:hypothetical protein
LVEAAVAVLAAASMRTVGGVVVGVEEAEFTSRILEG